MRPVSHPRLRHRLPSAFTSEALTTEDVPLSLGPVGLDGSAPALALLGTAAWATTGTRVALPPPAEREEGGEAEGEETHGAGGTTQKKRKRRSGGAPGVLLPEDNAGATASPDNGQVLRRCLTFEATPRGGGGGRSKGTPLWSDDVATPHPVGLHHPGRVSGAFVTPVVSSRVPRRHRSSVEGGVLPETPATGPDAGGSMAAPPSRSGGRPRSTAGDGAGLGGGCHKCRCVKSHCLKLYCECFANGIFCSACSCTACLNTQSNAALVAETRAKIESRNPMAFAPRVIVAADGTVTPAHKTGCRCKKSACQKRYCECFEASVLCGSHCKCEGCRNCDPGAGGGGQKGAAAPPQLRGPFKLPERRATMEIPLTPALGGMPDALLSPRLTLSPGLLPLAMPFALG